MSRSNKTQMVGDFIVSKIIGERPKKPASYELRKKRKAKGDLEFCADFDKKLKEWDDKAKEIRNKNKKEYPEYEEPKKPFFELKSETIIEDFKNAYKFVNKKDFKLINEYSNSNEPEVFMKTLIYYFNKDERFFKSPLLREDLSKPSFEKGTLVIGKYGCGKTSTFKSLVKLFNHYVEHIKLKGYSNEKELLDKFTISQCVATEVILNYKEAMNGSRLISDIVNPLKTIHDLYIDDLLKEEILYKSKDNEVNLFKDILTLRDERRRRTHISMNFNEKKTIKGKILENTEKSLNKIAEKYNGTVHDRIFGSYNIIELKAKSLRR